MPVVAKARTRKHGKLFCLENARGQQICGQQVPLSTTAATTTTPSCPYSWDKKIGKK